MVPESKTRACRHLIGACFMLAAIFTDFPVLAQKDRPIYDIQGEENSSPFVREPARVTGIVTARIKNGFFIQMPDDKADKKPATSEGIFVFTGAEPDENAAVGNLVSVTGMIEEFGPKTAPFALTVTEISMQKGRDMVQVLSKNNPLPKPVVLSPGDFFPKTIDQLERYEGMRVQVVGLTAVSPTGGGRVDPKTASAASNGIFYAVLTGTPRPFREPGLDYYDYVFMNEKDRANLIKTYPKLLLFDDNPERVRIESMAQPGAKAIDVSTFAEIKNLGGVMHYAGRSYSILVDPDSKPSVANTVKIGALPPPKPDHFLVAGMNLENFFDDVDDLGSDEIVSPEALQKRMKKISVAIRLFMQMPDVIGTIEVENLAVLKRLAEKINADAVAGGKPDPKYEAYLVEGNDQRGIDVGFLVKSSRIKVIETKQLGRDEKYKNPVKNEDAFVNDRPPLMLRASIEDPKTTTATEFTVIVNHLKSFNGYNDPKIWDDVRLKKRLQAEFLARFVNERQKANPDECIALVGDFNSYQFEDGITDPIGTIKGTPTQKNAVLNPSEDLVERDLINLVDLINIGQRYSYSFDGNAQVLDHIIINDAMRKHIAGFAYTRLNADFPEIDRGEAAKVQRFSDHDPPVAFFTIEDTTKK